jgi:hypothetical protein
LILKFHPNLVTFKVNLIKTFTNGWLGEEAWRPAAWPRGGRWWPGARLRGGSGAGGAQTHGRGGVAMKDVGGTEPAVG